MIRIFSYSKETRRMETPTIPELPRHLGDPGRTIWVDLEAPTDEEAGVLGGIFGFHVLAVEDCLGDSYLPKVDCYDGAIYMILHAADPKAGDHLVTQKVDVFAGRNFLVTHHAGEVKGIFDTRGAVAKNPGSLLRSPDWLFYGILNAMVDNYKPAVAALEQRVKASELAVRTGSDHRAVETMVQANRELLFLEGICEAQRDVIAQLFDGRLAIVAEENRLYFRDIVDHVGHLLHTAKYNRTLITDTMTSLLLAETGRTRNAARWTAALATAGLPVVAAFGFYAMNLSGLPGAGSEQAPLILLGAVAVTAGVAAVVFKRMGWF